MNMRHGLEVEINERFDVWFWNGEQWTVGAGVHRTREQALDAIAAFYSDCLCRIVHHVVTTTDELLELHPPAFDCGTVDTATNATAAEAEEVRS